MKKSVSILRRAFAVMLGAILFASLLPGAALAGSLTQSVHAGNFDVYDYFVDAYGLTAEKAYPADGEPYYYRTFFEKTINERGVTVPVYHPFQTLLYEEFQYLLQSQKEEDLGYYAIVFGGEWEAKTADVLDSVNQAAAAIAAAHTTYREDSNGKQVKDDDAFINAVYNFDFKLNGGVQIEARLAEYGFPTPAEEYDTDIRTDLTGYGSGDNRKTTTNLYKTLYDTLNVPSDAPAAFTSGNTVAVKGGAELSNEIASLNAISSPSVLLIRKELVGDSVKNTVVDFLDAQTVDFTDAAAKQEFTAKVWDLLSKAPEGLQKFDFFRHIWGVINQDFVSTFNGQGYSVTYNNLTDPDHIFHTVTYPELVRILKSEGNYAIYFGGAWCPYSKGFLAPLNLIAKSYDVNAIYVYDPRIDGISGTTMIRAAESGSGLFQRLYANLMTYFGVDYNSFAFPSSHDTLSVKLGVADEDVEIAGRKLTKIGVPTLVGYNRDNVNEDGEPAPLFGTASTADTFGNIVTGSSEPVPYAAEYAPDEPKEGVLYYKDASYLEAFRLSVPGRREENNIIRFLDAFFEGQLTYKLK